MHSCTRAPFSLASVIVVALVLPGSLWAQEGTELPRPPTLASIVPDLLAPPDEPMTFRFSFDPSWPTPVPLCDPGTSAATWPLLPSLPEALPMDGTAGSSPIPGLLDRGRGQGAGADPLERLPRQLNGKQEGEWGSLTAQVTLPQTPDSLLAPSPLPASAWQTDQALRLAMAGSFFVYGNLGTKIDATAPQTSQVAGQTGLAWKVPVGSQAEFQVRSGPRLTYVDPLRSTVRSQSDWLLEVQARCPLVYGVGLEYQGTAIPATSTTQHDQLNQDVHLAFPLGTSGKVQVGAKHRWESNTTPQPLADSMQLYLGLQLTH